MHPRRFLYPLTAAVVLAYFLFFTWPSLRMYFDGDDIFNLYFAWDEPLRKLFLDNLLFWEGASRPLGGLFYRGIFAAAGFNPLPFHIVALALCAANMAICFWCVNLISTSERVAAVATLLFAFHSRLIEVWYRTAVIYDVLCFTFVWLAAGIYISARRASGRLSIGRGLAVVLLYLLALDSKEMAVVLPVFLFAYELLFHTNTLKKVFLSRAMALIVLVGLITLVYCYGKLHGPHALSAEVFYQPDYSPARLERTWSICLAHLFVLKQNPAGLLALGFVGGLLLVALAARSRQLIFAWVVIFFGLLPVAFVADRGGYVIYLSWVGWVLYAGALLVALEDLLTRSHPQYRTALACLVFLLVGWRCGKIYLHDLRVDSRGWLYDEPRIVREMAQQMQEMQPILPRHGRILFQEDSFSTDEWTPLFLMRLLYRDHGLLVDRIKVNTPKPANWDQNTSPPGTHYDYVFTCENGHYRQVTPVVATLR